MHSRELPMIRVAIFASGNGTNAQALIDYFKASNSVCIALLLSNRRDAFALERAAKEKIPAVLLTKDSSPEEQLAYLREYHIDFVVLAGYLALVPQALISAYPRRIVNLHPALLPKYGGRGMYGEHVHRAVLQAQELFSGITVHYVDEHYDTGAMILQATCAVFSNDTPASLATRIHALEHYYLPRVVDLLCAAI